MLRERAARRARRGGGDGELPDDVPEVQSRWLSLVYFVGVVVLPVGVLLLALLVPDDRLEPATAVDTGPLTVQPEAVTDSDVRVLAVELGWGEGVAVAAVDRAGVVTQVYAEPGDQVVGGDRLYAVDGVTVVALASGQPLFEPIGPEAAPSTVVALSEVLIAFGLLDEPVERWSAELEEAALALQRQLGVAQPAVPVDHRLFLWLLEPNLAVETVEVRQGWPAPNGAESALVGARPLEVVSVGGQSRFQAELSLLPGTYVVSYGGVELGEWEPDEPMSEEIRAALAAELDGHPDTVTVELQLQAPMALVTLPSSAVITDAQGRTCVWRADQDAGPVEVSVLRGTTGRIEIADPGLTDPVLIDPLDAGSGLSCTS